MITIQENSNILHTIKNPPIRVLKLKTGLKVLHSKPNKLANDVDINGWDAIFYQIVHGPKNER